MNCSTPGFPVHHQLPELAQTHVHQFDDAMQPSHPLSSPSPPAFNLPQHQGLFQWVNSLQPHGLQHARLPCSSPTPRTCSQAHVHWISDTKQPSHLLPPSSLFAFDLSQHQGLYQWVGSSHQVPTWSTFTSRCLCSCLTLLRDAEHLEVITKGLPLNMPVISPGIWYGFNMGSTASSDPSTHPPLPLAGTAHIAPEKWSLTSFHLNLCVKTSKQAGIQVVSFHGDFTHFLSSHHIGEGVLPASVSPC